ncbi:MAG: hypothetical protein QM784_38645 [Polyangiaceae bacterium]
MGRAVGDGHGERRGCRIARGNPAEKGHSTETNTARVDEPAKDLARLPIRIRWDGADACRPEADVANHLRRLLGGAGEARITDLDVRIAITPVPSGLDIVIDADAPDVEFDEHSRLPVAGRSR